MGGSRPRPSGRTRVTSATEHAKTLLAAIIPDRRDLLDRALQHLSGEHFVDRTHANLFAMLEKYSEVTGAVMTRAALGDMLTSARVDTGTIALYQETYDLLHDGVVDDSGYRWALEQLRELAAERATGSALTQSMEILTRGVPGEGGETLKGHTDARNFLLGKIADIDRHLHQQDAPEGDMRVEADDILADYAEAKAAHAAGHNAGVNFGVPAIDDKVDGLQRGELVLIAGWTSDGKTTMCVQLAWSAAVEQHKNVVFFTTETVRNTVRRRIIARHSCVSEFAIPGGLNSREIKKGTLDPDRERALHRVVTDFNTNPTYGKVYICQVPAGASVSYLESKLQRLNRLFPIDLVIMDYLGLLRSDRKRQSDREELSGNLKHSKQIATTFADGAGVPFVSPWQVSRTARQYAKEHGYYAADALSDTSEAEKSADLILGLLAPAENTARIAPIKGQIMKNRDGEKASALELEIDYATARFSSRETSRSGRWQDANGAAIHLI